MEMKAKMQRYGILLAGVVVCVLAASVVAKATQTLTVPNAAFYTYNLAAGANSSPITPVPNQAVLMIGSQTAVGYRGVAMATILRVPSSFIEWTGVESPSAAAVTSGFAAAPGAHVLYLDFSHLVDVQVASADTIYIHNGNSVTQTGTLELIW